MRHIGLTQSGTVLVEMTIDEWQNLGAIITDVELLAQQVISHRALTGMNQEQFAKRAGISRTYLSMLESGKGPNLSLNIVTRIHEAIDQP